VKGIISAFAGLGIALLVLIVLSQSMFVVDEREQVVITEFGKPVGEAITQAGLHFKRPFVQDANRFDKRVQEWDGERNQIPTADKRFIWVDTTARWRIADPLLFLTSVQNENGAQTRLDDVLDAATRDQISSYHLVEAVRVSNRLLDEPAEADGEEILSSENAERVKVGRDEIARLILESAKPIVLSQFGIDLLDLRIKRINYVDSVRDKVYERMKSERERIAEKYRSEGEGLKEKISGRMVREQKEI
jgi:membrane protease subunit HflC